MNVIILTIVLVLEFIN